MKDVLISVIVDGKNSPHRNLFIETCLKLAVKAFNSSILRESALNESGLSPADIAYDIIADLFAEENGKYASLNIYFGNTAEKINACPEDELNARLSALIISRTNQRLTDIKDENGEIFYKVRKAVRVFFQRNSSEYNFIIYDKEKYLFACGKSKLDFKLPEFEETVLINQLLTFDYRNYRVPEFIKNLFVILNTQDIFLKSISETKICNIITRLYKERLDNYVKENKNVSYINYDEYLQPDNN